MTLTISWSQLRLFEECRQKVALHRAGKRSKASNPRNFFGGTVLDRVVRDWLLDPKRQPGGMERMVEEVMEREERIIQDTASEGILRYRDENDRAALIESVKEAARGIEPSLVKYVLPFKFRVDYRFRIPMTVPWAGGKIEVSLIGAMDILVYDEVKDHWVVYDVKMTRDEGYWKKTRGQMTFYDLAVELEHGQPAKAAALLQPLCTQQVKPIPLNAERRTELLSHITAFAIAVLNNDMPYVEEVSKCNWCDYKHACGRFKSVRNAAGNKTASYGGR